MATVPHNVMTVLEIGVEDRRQIAVHPTHHHHQCIITDASPSTCIDGSDTNAPAWQSVTQSLVGGGVWCDAQLVTRQQ
jgi:hypothetical protein